MTTGYTKATVIYTKALLALQGKTVETDSNATAVAVLNQFDNLGGVKLGATGEEIVSKIENMQEDGARVAGIVANTVMGDIQVSLIITTDEHPVTDFADRNGVLAYVHNASCDWCSEFGYIFLEKRTDGFAHRIG